MVTRKPEQFNVPAAEGLVNHSSIWKNISGIVSVSIEIKSDNDLNAWQLLMTLPEGFRPVGNTIAPAISNNGPCHLEIYPNGRIVILPTYIPVPSGIRFVASYFEF